MKIYEDIEQGTQEWFDVRKLKFTASHANTILACGKGLQTLINDMLVEYYSSGAFEEYTDRFSNKHLERGKKFEDKARTIYSLETGNEVKQVGFIEMNDYIGCSPDGLVGEDGLLEIKNLSDKVFFKLLTDGRIDKSHYDQMQMQLFVTGRRWCDYFAFNPNFKQSYKLVRVKIDTSYTRDLFDALNKAVDILRIEKSKYDKIMAQ